MSAGRNRHSRDKNRKSQRLRSTIRRAERRTMLKAKRAAGRKRRRQ